MSSQKSSKWGAGPSKWGIAQAAGALVAKPEKSQAVQKGQTKPRAKPEATTKTASAPHVPHVPKTRVSVVQPHARYHARPLGGGAGRVASERDSRLGRIVVTAVLGISILVFGSNYAGLWESPGQQVAREEAERKRPGALKDAADKLRIAQERREADRRATEKLALDREAQRKAADDEAARRAKDQAVKTKAAQERRPPPASALPNLAETDCQMNKPLAAIVPACSEIIAKHNDFADAYFIRAWALRERNQAERALTDFTRAIELRPTQQPAYYSQRALTYVRLRDFDRAFVDYNKAIELNPRSPTFHNDRGAAYLDLKDYSRALADFNRAIELDPKYAVPYNNRARTYVLSKSDHASAIVDLDRAIELSPKYALALENRGLSHLELKDLAKALADFDSAITLNPRSARAFNARGVAYERQGNRDRAIADYRRALDADQKFSTARENLTRLGEKP